MDRGALILGAVLTMLLAAGVSADGQDGQAVTIQLSSEHPVPISPLLYGVNYDFNIVPAAEFSAFAADMTQTAHARLARFPGGWNAEWYDWDKNIEYGKRAPASPGAAPDVVLAAFPVVSFITPSQGAVANANQIDMYTKATAPLVQRFGEKVRYWEIGNEWWLQTGAKNNDETRQRNLRGYAALLDAVVPAMKRANPSIKIYATGDWTKLDDIASLRKLTGEKVWAQVDGFSLHPYCGTQDANVLCSSIPQQFAQIRRITGKDQLYASEWAAVRAQNANDFGIRNANYTVDAVADLALAGVQLGAYWPPVREIPVLGLVSNDLKTPTATGMAFSWMSTFYEGEALKVSGDPLAVAARHEGKINVIIPSMDNREQHIRIDLTGSGMTKVDSAEVLYSSAPDDVQGSQHAEIVSLPTTLTRDASQHIFVDFVLNPGTADRGRACEIGRITLE